MSKIILFELTQNIPELTPQEGFFNEVSKTYLPANSSQEEREGLLFRYFLITCLHWKIVQNFANFPEEGRYRVLLDLTVEDCFNIPDNSRMPSYFHTYLSIPRREVVNIVPEGRLYLPFDILETLKMAC